MVYNWLYNVFFIIIIVVHIIDGLCNFENVFFFLFL